MQYTYKIITMQNMDLIQRIEDGAWIPKDIDNGDYRAYLLWLESQQPKKSP